MSKLSFKRDARETGLSSVTNPYPNVQIKSDGNKVGIISAPRPLGHAGWKIMLMIKRETDDGNSNCNWKWITFKTSFETEAEAREWLNNNWDKIETKYEIRVGV